MIVRVWSDLPTFREARFEEGFNVVMADTTEDSKETESTNGLGKTTLIRIVHFCLGMEIGRDKVLTHPDLANVTFGLDMLVDGEMVAVKRNTSLPKQVIVSAWFVDGLRIEKEKIDAEFVLISTDDWKLALTSRFYPPAKGVAVRQPSFRDILLYLVRLGKAAFTDPQMAFQGQSGPGKRLDISFLLGLNWGLQDAIHEQIANRSHLNDASKVRKAAEEAGAQRSIGELEAERVALEAQLNARKKELDSFNLRDDYRDLEQQLSGVDRELHDAINENFSDTRLRDFYQESASEVPEADSARPIAILKEAGAIFKEEALRKLSEVATFHEQVYRNRKEFLRAEINRLAVAIKARDVQIDRLSSEKQRVLKVLRSSGAIETLIVLQRTHTDLNARYQVLVSQIEDRKQVDRRSDELTATIARDRTILKQDLDDRRQQVDEVRALFAEYTQDLYGRPGRLGVDVGSNGYSFSFTIDRQGSDGVDQMVVFCFDLTIASVWAKHKRGFPVLIHDSSLFADVDPRQYAKALKLAAINSEKYGFQYICCLNVGSLPKDHFGEFSLEPYVRLRLHDESVEGRLLGKQLPPREKNAS
ncbi:uncharacterized protein YydD (DUF2326 family) [Bradyrhizobium sp. CIR48]|uniref:DUF2326 domain-containing protein n=1 Tax=Bradyrhizobium sp. CIR48 TaxID=2663840 RepID=UPI0016064A9A|nr:DUF2326 domain-containing protein [Bradyrhizobium sp. CIR48]MBB4427858.1 uncharacterized protein YydD (DUF2326 family) [Bradyrhizobium sp. CIR48]